MSPNQIYDRLTEIFNDIKLSDEEKRYLSWLSIWDYNTVDNFASMFNKLKDYKGENK